MLVLRRERGAFFVVPTRSGRVGIPPLPVIRRSRSVRRRAPRGRRAGRGGCADARQLAARRQRAGVRRLRLAPRSRTRPRRSAGARLRVGAVAVAARSVRFASEGGGHARGGWIPRRSGGVVRRPRAVGWSRGEESPARPER